jgi:IclR family acetate operon transcriptional repressor
MSRSTTLPPPSLGTSPVSHAPISIQVLERAMSLLDVLAKQTDPVPLKDLAAATGLHTSTTHRILNDLVVGRYACDCLNWARWSSAG